jgi:ATP-dependent protease ClpP protease subunit
MLIEQKIRPRVIRFAFYILLFTLVSLTAYPSSSFATITLTNGAVPLWDISGVITKSDLNELALAVEVMNKTKGTPIFRLNSEGGDVEVAMAIGRQLRHFQAQAITWEQGRCYSACVFILAGAVRRSLSNSIGIHRPYSSSTTQRDYHATQTAQRQLSKLAKEYLEEVNVSPSLYDAMVNVPPEKIRLLSESELMSFGILEVDPVEQELEDASEARKYGLSKIEFLRRKSQVETTCWLGTSSGEFASYYRCRVGILGARK